MSPELHRLGYRAQAPRVLLGPERSGNQPTRGGSSAVIPPLGSLRASAEAALPHPPKRAVRLYHKDWVGGGKPTCRWWGRRIGAPGSTTHLLEEGSAPTPIFITDVRELYSTAITASILRAFSSAATEPFPFSKSPSRTCSRIHRVVAGTPRRALHPSAWAPSIRSFLSFDPGGASDCDGMVGLFH